MSLPYLLLYSDYNTAIGALQEDFVVETLKSIRINPHCLKSTRDAKTPDYIMPFGNREIVIEVGGKGKGREQFKAIIKQKRSFLSIQMNLINYRMSYVD